MTTAIEVTKREMYNRLANLKAVVSPSHLSMGLFEIDLESHLEALRQDRANLVTERDTLRNRVQVLEMANATSGEVIRSLKDEAAKERKARMKARLEEFATPVSNSAENVASATLDGKAAVIIGDLMEGAAILDQMVKNMMSRQSQIRAFNQATCMHSFHCVPLSRDEKIELCTFCGVGK